jgi:hypothetical protein
LSPGTSPQSSKTRTGRIWIEATAMSEHKREPIMSDDPNFVTCHCQHCDGHIEFNVSYVGESVACPHCGKETTLHGTSAVGAIEPPPIVAPPVIPLSILPLTPTIPNKRFRAVSLTIGLFGLAVLVSLIFISVANGNFKKIVGESIKGKEWSTSKTVTNGSVQVTISDPFSGVLFLDNGEGFGVTPLQGNYLQISIWVSNTDSNMKMDFSTWRDNASLSDEHGNVYRRITPGFGQKLYNLPADTASIYPGSDFRDMVIFEMPVGTAKKLYLQLPANNFGGWGTVRFEISYR